MWFESVSRSVLSRSPRAARAHTTTVSKDGSAPLGQHKYSVRYMELIVRVQHTYCGPYVDSQIGVTGMRASIGQDHMDFCSSASVSGSLITMLIMARTMRFWVWLESSSPWILHLATSHARVSFTRAIFFALVVFPSAV